MGGGSMRSFTEYNITSPDGTQKTLDGTTFDKAYQYAIDHPYEDPNNEDDFGWLIFDGLTGARMFSSFRNIATREASEQLSKNQSRIALERMSPEVASENESFIIRGKDVDKLFSKEVSNTPKVTVDRMSKVRKDARKATTKK